jgi:hypothetical protein
MTTSYRIEHEFPSVPLDIFVQNLNHAELNKMLTALPSFKSRELIEEQELENGEKQWCFLVSAAGDLPPAVSAIASPDLFKWHEKSHYVPKEKTLHFKIEPLSGSSKFEGSGRFIYSKLKNGTKRVLEGEMNVKIPFVGKIVESFLVNELKKNYEVEPGVQSKFYAKMMRS